MRKFLFYSVFLILLSTLLPRLNVAMAQVYEYCAQGDTGCSAAQVPQPKQQCNTGYIPPCPTGGEDCCTYYSATHSQNCPSSISCISSATTPTQATTPTSPPNTNSSCYTAHQTNSTLCSDSVPCNDTTNYVCQNDAGAIPCTGRCVSKSTGTSTGSTTASSSAYDACQFIADSGQQANCHTCAGTDNGVWTAIGCIKTKPDNLIGIIINFALGIAGGIAFLLILFGGLQIMTSAGNPEQLNAGRELVTSAIIGLILILFSIFLLQFIGVNIIGIPGFIIPK